MDRATPNLPARSFTATATFYDTLGFTVAYRDSGWMILARGGLQLEFFPFPDLDPATSSFGACLRVDDLAAMIRQCEGAGIPVAATGMPRLQLPGHESSGLVIAYLVDPDGSLLRLIQNP